MLSSDAVFTTNTTARRALYLVLITLVVGYAAFYWRFCHFYDGDHGRWMYEAWLFSKGEVPYRDIPFQYPPLALYLYGWACKLYSGGLVSNYVVSALLYFGICTLGWVWLRKHLPPAVLIPACFAAFFSTTYRIVHWGASPLSVGTYAPSQPLGLCLVLAMAIGVFAKTRTALIGVSLGVLAGLCFFAKQDFWIPALTLAGLGCFDWEPTPHIAPKHCLTVLATTAATLGLGLYLLAAHAGSDHVVEMFTGYGQLHSDNLRPGLTLLFKNLAFGGLATAVVAASLLWAGERQTFLKRTVAWALPLSVVCFVPLVPGTSARGWVELAQSYIFSLPAFLFPLGVVFMRWRTGRPQYPTLRLFLLTLIALSMRSRYGFGTYAWFGALFDIPVLYWLYVCLTDSAPRAERTSRIVCWTGAGLHLALWVGSHTFAGIVETDTPHGWVRMPRREATTFASIKAQVDQADPSGKRPLIALRSASFNFLLDHKNPAGLTHGFLTHESEEEIFRRIQEAKPLVLISAGQIKMVPDHYAEVDGIDGIRSGYGPTSRLLEDYLPVRTGQKSPWTLCLPRQEVLARESLIRKEPRRGPLADAPQLDGDLVGLSSR